MYSTCLFCHSPLGTNEVIEHFPVGRRLAFDAAKGRLWVVCRKCERWNLTPIEERWEAIEECERMFRNTKLRVSTDNIGLGRVRDGLELVRVGDPQRPEMAAWRYGDQFGRRQRRYLGWGSAIVGIGGAYVVVGTVLGDAAFGWFMVSNFVIGSGGGLVYSRAMRVRLAIPGASGPMIVSEPNVKKAMLRRADNESGWALSVPGLLPVRGESGAPGRESKSFWQWATGDDWLLHRTAPTEFAGDEAIRIAGQLLPKLNLSGARKNTVHDAVRLLERQGGPRDVFAHACGPRSGVSLESMPKPIRLALEMAAHEDTERRALAGELAMLESQWKDAEEIAAISDNMFLPAGVETWIKRQQRDE